MQPRPAVPVDGVITISTSNRAQQRGPHGAFRYFGKLAPDVTGRVLDLAANELGSKSGPVRVIDTMCGSGTTLIEAAARGWYSTGIDVNDVARLYATAKTQAVDHGLYLASLDSVLSDPIGTPAEADERFAPMRNAERWFSHEARLAIAGLARNIDRLPPGRERRLLKAVLLSKLRRMSNASARTGRIFYDPSSAVEVVGDFLDGAKSVLDVIPSEDLPTRVIAGDARQTELPPECSEIVFMHPPYFALYRYSSDVLRFELEVGGYSRREISKNEVKEGWKSGDPRNLDSHVTDMGDAFAEARRLMAPSGVLALVTSNSTLGDIQLPVIDRLVDEAQSRGLVLSKHYERTAHHGSASYHRSARTDKVIQQDHVLLFRHS